MKKRLLLSLYLFLCLKAYSSPLGIFSGNSVDRDKTEYYPETKLTENNAYLGTDEIEIDLSTNQIVAPEGVNFQYNELKVRGYEFERKPEEGRIITNGLFEAEFNDGTNLIRMESLGGEASEDGEYAKLNETKGFFDVRNITGAKVPNEKIYFGSKSTEYNGRTINFYDSWATTTNKGINAGNHKLGEYYVTGDLISILPDNRIDFYNANLFLGNKKMLPFDFPWFAINIRPGSEVPLFPEIGSEDEYGLSVSWGLLFGEKDSFYKGGFAPKYSTDLGFLVGKAENEFDLQEYGDLSVELTDALVVKKGDRENRWQLDLEHDYQGEYGHVDFKYKNVTQNLIEELKDIRDDNEDDGLYDPNNPLYIGDSRPSGGDSINFYMIDADLEKLGPDKDISIYSQVQLLDDREDYQEIVDERLDSLEFDKSGDHDLFADVRVEKDNDDYGFSAYYLYLDDLDPGSKPYDLYGAQENFGFAVNDKEHKIKFTYDDKNEETYRPLRSWERNSNLDTAADLEYVPFTIKEYDKKDSRIMDLQIGEYTLANDISFGLNYNQTIIKEELATDDDYLRLETNGQSAIQNNDRDRQYNRFEHKVYNDFHEDRLSFLIHDEHLFAEVAGGRTEEEFWDRKGLYSYDEFVEGEAYNVYINESDFYEGKVGFKDFEVIDGFGKFHADYALRYDDYDKGHNTHTLEDTDGGDSTLRHQLNVGHQGAFYDNLGDPSRSVDLSLNNKFNFFFQDYDYNGSDSDLEIDEDAERTRLKSKLRTRIFTDEMVVEVGNTLTNFDFSYQDAFHAADKDQRLFKEMNTKMEFNLGGTKLFDAYYDFHDRYTNVNTVSSNFNDLSKDNFGLGIYLDDHSFFIDRENIGYHVRDIVDTDDADENTKNHSLGYKYTWDDDFIQLSYTRGTNKRFNRTQQANEIDISNNIYTLSYLNGGDTEHFYKFSFEDYDQDEELNKNYGNEVYSFRYEYRDKSYTEEELGRYAQLEYDKLPGEISQRDLENIQSLLEDRSKRRLDFQLRSISEDEFYLPEDKRNIQFYGLIQRNKERYRNTSNWDDSLERIQVRLFYSENRWGVGYEFEQEADYTNINNADSWRETERDHEISLYGRFGKPSEGWRFKTFVRILDDLDGLESLDEQRKTFDRYGIEIAKEMNFYEISSGFTRKYVADTDDYEWQISASFKLLTFPDNPLLGLGIAKDGDDDTITIEPYILDEVDIDDLDTD